MRGKFKSSINFYTTGQFHLPGQHHWLAVPRAGALFFALHRDYFIVPETHNPYPDLVPLRNFTMTLGFAAIYWDWQKTRHRDPSVNSGQAPTAPN